MSKPLMFLVRDTYKEWTVYMKSLAAEAGIPDSYRMILTFLLRHPGANQKDLAEHRGITTSSISQAVKEMQLTGYLKKEPDDNDQRYMKLYLTEQGEEIARKLHGRMHAADDRLKELLTPETESELRQILSRLTEIITEELPKC